MPKLSQKATLKRILLQLKQYKFLIALSVFLALLTVVCNLSVPILFGEAIDSIVSQNEVDLEKIKTIFILIAAIIILGASSQWLMNTINNLITYNVVRDIRQQAFTHLQQLPLSYLDSHSRGDIVSRNIADVDQFADGLLMGFTQFFTGVLTILGTLVIMLFINWIIALVVVVLTPLSLFVAKFISSRTYTMFKKTSSIRGEQTSFIDEMVGNLKVVQAFGHEEENNKKFKEINERLTSASLQSIFFSSLTNPTTRFVNAIVYAVVAFAGAASLINSAAIPFVIAFSVGKLTSLLSYANQYAKPFNEISGVITELQNAIACAGRIYELIDETPQSSDNDKKDLNSVKGNVVFDHISFSYQKDKSLLKNISLSIKNGQRVAIVGPTGCGKTTLINLLMRFYDLDEGRILIDVNDIQDITRKSLRSNYGMVLQESWLKSGTIRDNLTMGKPNCTEEELISAAKASHAHQFIMQMGGYDTQIGEDGGNLSQGQKQLLCITRIMLSLPPILILDEATSSIDTRTELMIQNAFAKMMKGRTSFIVAHRLSTIREADVILVMKDGNIIEQGNHNSLLKQNGFYAELYNSQFAS